MIIDGKQLASSVEEQILRTLSGWAAKPKLALIIVGENPVIESFVRIKHRVAQRLGITVLEKRFPMSVSEQELMQGITSLAHDPSVDGIVVQLPLPESFNIDQVLKALPLDKDVDVLSRDAIATFANGDAPVLPPVAGAVQEILEFAKVDVVGMPSLILGHGRLVGVPVSILLRHNGADVTVIDRPIPDLASHVMESRVVISGVGKPGLISKNMLTPQCILIDAGTSESGGKLVGDADADCSEVAKVFTPVPGGVGPLSVVMLFKNLCILARNSRGKKE